MGFLDDVRAKRQKLADVLSDEEYSGIRKIVEELYPDRAHFIYELLQNAEYAGATQASFALDNNSVSFEHNGRAFTNEDVWGITNIGKSPHQDQEGKRFGVGFKAVFAYTENPYIWSPTFSFAISDLVLPTAIPSRSELGQRTRFEFPFNNRKKGPPEAYAEIETGLDELAETTLLFLGHLESIQWKIGQKRPVKVRRVEHSEHHIEVLKQSDGRMTASSHFLRFSDSVQGLTNQCASVAFALDYLPKVRAFDAGKALAKQLKIIPANPGRVAVLFPAEKETSGLRFHLHAPFVPELSRASIKDTPVNEPLFKQLAKLTAASLHAIRAMNLLTGEFLGVLPNPQDVLATPYEPIRTSITDEMNNEPLTPTHSRSHAPARHLLQASASLKELLSTKDLEVLVKHDGEPFHWAIGVSQKNSNMDRFLSGLAITTWDSAQFLALLEAKASETKPDAEFFTWIATKPCEWHQQFYSFLCKEYPGTYNTYPRLRPLRIVRLSKGTNDANCYSVGTKCYWPSEAVEQDECVAQGVYLSGKNKQQQEEARKLLAALGVDDFGEADQVQAILKQRYTYEAKLPSRRTYLKDLRGFIALVEREPRQAQMFGEYYIFERECGDWVKPNGVFLDSPYLETGLSAYYNAIGASAPRAALAHSYEHSGIPVDKLRQFAEAVGVQKHLEVVETSISDNPEKFYLWGVAGERHTSPLNHDFVIPGLAELLSRPTVELSKLIWQTMCSLPRHPNRLQAEYRKNEMNGSRYAASQLVHQLRTCAWVPQTNGTSVRPAEASSGLLPDGFPLDDGNGWLSAVQFGQQRQQRVEETKKRASVAKELGFSDAGSLQRAQQFTSLPLSDQERVLAEFQAKQHRELPKHEPRNPKRRAARVAQQAADAPDRITEKRLRSVPIGKDDVKEKADQYLRAQYTQDDEMICQVCKTPLPFKLDDGTYYCETVEFVTELKKRHHQNYLALCPNHSAMFQLANGSEDSMKETFIEMAGNELEIVLAQADTTIYFTKTHIADLKEVLRVESAQNDDAGEAP